MKILTGLLLFFAFNSTLYPQSYKFLFSLGEFESAESFYINSAGMLYITDTGSDEIYKYDTLGTLLKETGGYGWSENTFDDPVDVYATPLNIYITDKNNHRIQSFDKDLNFVSQLSSRESDNPDEQFGYPLSCGASGQGDLYILDSENSRVIKFDLFGNFKLNFGGYDAGDYMLSAPVKLSVSPIGFVYVLDKNRLVIFDQYGNGFAIRNLDTSFTSLNIIFNQLTLNSDSRIFSITLNSSDNSIKPVITTGFDKLPIIQSSLIFNKKLYVLTSNEILVFEKENTE